MNKHNMKKAACAAIAALTICTAASCGCEQEENVSKKEHVVESMVSGAEVMNQLWAGDIDESAEIIDGYHATSVNEVLNIWKQAHMQKNDEGIVNGNGALIYGICSPDLREDCLDEIKKIGLWNFYYSSILQAADQTMVPQGMVFSKPERHEDKDRIYYEVEVNAITYSGEKERYELQIDFISGGYYLTSRSESVIVDKAD